MILEIVEQNDAAGRTLDGAAGASKHADDDGGQPSVTRVYGRVELGSSAVVGTETRHHEFQQ